MFDMLIDMKGGTDPQTDRHEMNIIVLAFQRNLLLPFSRVHEALFCHKDGDSRRSSKSLVPIYKTTQRHIQNDSNLHNQHHENLTFHSFMTVLFGPHDEISFRNFLLQHPAHAAVILVTAFYFILIHIMSQQER
jgi:hypothetical protein